MPTCSPRRAAISRSPLLRRLFLAYLAWLLLLLVLHPAPASAALPGSVPSQCGVTMSCPTAPGTPTPPAGPAGCGPAGGGPTCGTPAVASIGDQGGVNVGAGNPINVISGNKYQREDDLPAL
ncbi:MAG: hypothetical protein H7327_13825, partial [Herminiimonas sp.]|nr:hypothetical protein [Herminiimonas sp.]